jgi:hypothetical protein
MTDEQMIALRHTALQIADNNRFPCADVNVICGAADRLMDYMLHGDANHWLSKRTDSSQDDSPRDKDGYVDNIKRDAAEDFPVRGKAHKAIAIYNYLVSIGLSPEQANSICNDADLTARFPNHYAFNADKTEDAAEIGHIYAKAIKQISGILDRLVSDPTFDEREAINRICIAMTGFTTVHAV